MAETTLENQQISRQKSHAKEEYNFDSLPRYFTKCIYYYHMML